MAEDERKQSSAAWNPTSPDGEANQVDPIAPYVANENDPVDGEFEIGIVLAGAISAGAFSAGVFDFLIEALDAWEAAKAEPGGESVPMHQVRLRVVAGASAGSMNGAIAAAALQYQFQHVRATTPVHNYTNPFYESWVKSIDIKYLLEHQDLAASPILQSLLDSTVLNKITGSALDAAGPPKHRAYLDGRVRFIFTQGGLRGIPYYISMKGPAYGGLTMTLHKSFRSFTVGYNGNVFARRPDDMRVDATVYPKTSTAGWSELGNAALGSGAFPIGLTPRYESRNPADLDYRYVVIPDDQTGTLGYCQIFPAWTQTVDGVSHPAPNPYCEFVVDGGTMDNEPLDMARTELAGLVGFNIRDGAKANRSVIMIDPFPDDLPDFSVEAPAQSNLLASALGLVGAWKSQARFSPVDIALAADKDTYSRYLIAPTRKDNGSPAEKESNGYNIASAALGGFGGFLSKEFRRHDYLLGRRNCQQFLAEYFSLPLTNHLVRDLPPDVQRKWVNKAGEIPIIPLMPSLRAPEPLPDWPRKPVSLGLLSQRLGNRFGEVVNVAIAASGFKFGWFKRVVAGWAVDGLRDFVLKKAVASVKADLEKRNLKTSP